MLMKMEKERVSAGEDGKEKRKFKYCYIRLQVRMHCKCFPRDSHYRVSEVERRDLPQGQTSTESLTPVYVIQF